LLPENGTAKIGKFSESGKIFSKKGLCPEKPGQRPYTF
jgi:hypothetical protein